LITAAQLRKIPTESEGFVLYHLTVKNSVAVLSGEGALPARACAWGARRFSLQDTARYKHQTNISESTEMTPWISAAFTAIPKTYISARKNRNTCARTAIGPLRWKRPRSFHAKYF
jgi:hypothetical protein